MPIIHVPEILRGTTQRQTHLHMTGGIIAAKNASGWVVGPTLKEGVLSPIGIFVDEEVGNFCREASVTILGGDEVSVDHVLQSRIWSPILGQPALPSSADDAWQGIAVAAKDVGDILYSSLAQYLCTSLRAAGIRLRDASDEYHKQLSAALLKGQKPNLRFNNIPLIDLHLAFHSLLSEMASAKDYLASLLAMQAGAPPRIDSMSRLADWATPEIASKVAGLQLLLAAYDETGKDPWLLHLSNYRNLFLHREPIQTNELARWLILKEAQTSFGNILSIQMSISSGSEGGVVDALELFSALYRKLCRLTYTLAAQARYGSTPVDIVVS